MRALGERIASRAPARQTAEIHIRILRGSLEQVTFTCSVMSRFNALGTAEIERVA